MVQEDSTRKHPSSPRDAEAGDADTGRRRKGRPREQPADQTKAKTAAEDAAAKKGGNQEPLGEHHAERVASLQAELEEAEDRALRSRAEMENFKKRLSRQVEEERRYACLPMIHDLLPVLDNMDRAICAAENSENDAGLLEGFSMVAQQLRDVLVKYDCKEIEALDQPFDPHLHQAVSQQPTDESPANTVVAVVEKGYQLHDRVVRPSKVIVSTRPDE